MDAKNKDKPQRLIFMLPLQRLSKVHTGKFVYNSLTIQGLLNEFPTVFKD